MTIMSKAVKIRVGMIAAEIIKAGHAERFVPGANALPRDDRVLTMEYFVQRDRIELTDARFRDKYANYIRRYWGNQPTQTSGRDGQ